MLEFLWLRTGKAVYQSLDLNFPGRIAPSDRVPYQRLKPQNHCFDAVLHSSQMGV